MATREQRRADQLAAMASRGLLAAPAPAAAAAAPLTQAQPRPPPPPPPTELAYALYRSLAAATANDPARVATTLRTLESALSRVLSTGAKSVVRVDEAANAQRYLALVGFERRHLTANGLNEQVLVFAKPSVATLGEHVACLFALREAVEAGDDVWPLGTHEHVLLKLPLLVKVRVPAGGELRACFSPEDTIADVAAFTKLYTEDPTVLLSPAPPNLASAAATTTILPPQTDVATLQGVALVVVPAATAEQTRALAQRVQREHEAQLVEAANEQIRAAREAEQRRRLERGREAEVRQENIDRFTQNQRASARRQVTAPSVSPLPARTPGAGPPGARTMTLSDLERQERERQERERQERERQERERHERERQERERQERARYPYNT